MGQCCSSTGQADPRYSQGTAEAFAKRSKAQTDAQRTKVENDGIEEVLTPGYVENMYSSRSKGSPNSHNGSFAFYVR